MEFEYKNPSETFDGTPFEAAIKTVEQADEIADLLIRALKDIEVQGKNAFMERNLMAGNPPDAAMYSAQPEAEVIDQMISDVQDIKRRMELVKRAVGFDPSEDE